MYLTLLEKRRVIVCGCRRWTDRGVILKALRAVAPEGKARNLLVVHGGCQTGVDAIVQRLLRGQCEVHPANWRAHGPAAGPLRNRKMAEAGADLCLAFWDGRSKGTRDMILETKRAGILVLVVLRLVR